MTAAPLGCIETGGSAALVAAEAVILDLCCVLLGGKGSPLGTSDRGLLRRAVNGTRHLESCQIGMYVQAGDSMRGGQPCSDRCRLAREAASRGGQWLKAHERAIEAPQSAQLALLEAGG